MNRTIAKTSFDPADVPFDFERAYKFLKIKKTSDKFARMHDMVADLYQEYRDYFEPRYCYKICQVAGGQSGSFNILLDEGISFTGRGIHRLLTHSRYVACFVLTVGERIDEVHAAFSPDEFTESYFLDGIASTMTHGLLGLLEKELHEKAQALGCALGSRFSPGYAKWDLSEQKKLLTLVKADQIGVRLSDEYFMLPQKSLSGVYALQPKSFIRS